MFEYRPRESPHIESLESLQRLNEFQHVVPLSVEDELTQKQDVVGVVAVDDARLPFEAQLRYVQFPVVEEFESQSDDVLLAEG